MSKNFTLSEAADLVRCSDLTIRRAIRSGALPAVLVAGRYIVSEEDLAKFMRRHEGARKAATPPSPLRGEAPGA